MSTVAAHSTTVVPAARAHASVPALRAGALTDVGRQRTHNEDAFVANPERGIFVVVDGVGGAAAGEVAAAIAVERIALRLAWKHLPPAARLREAIAAANRAIVVESQHDAALQGMACVLTAVLIEDGTVHVGHVGDTRLYDIDRDGICKITRDHSVVGVQEDAGQLSEWEAMTHPRRNEILRDVGSTHQTPDAPDFIDLYTFAFDPSHALLLCSDGLSDLIPAVTIHQTVTQCAGEPQAAAAALIALANDAGGTDNITAVVVEGANFEGAVSIPQLAEPGAKPAVVLGGWHRTLMQWFNARLISTIALVVGAMSLQLSWLGQ